jgi:mono/diheme cytochrome c family protein
MDKVIIRVGLLLLGVFIILAVFYERPKDSRGRAAYLPEKGFIGNVNVGRVLFNQNCIQCHGNTLKGTNKGPSLLHRYYHPDHHADVAFYLAIFRGVQQHHWQFGDMPAFNSLSPESADHLLKYIRQQQRQNGLF